MRPAAVTRILVALLLFSATAHARNFSGFFTPEFPSSQRRAPIPVSASAWIELTASVSGNLRLRELGEYRLEGTLSDGKLELKLHQSDSGAPAGHAVGTVEGTRVELTVEFLDREGATRSRGRLKLEGAAEWGAPPAAKRKKGCATRAGGSGSRPNSMTSTGSTLSSPMIIPSATRSSMRDSTAATFI